MTGSPYDVGGEALGEAAIEIDLPLNFRCCSVIRQDIPLAEADVTFSGVLSASYCRAHAARGASRMQKDGQRTSFLVADRTAATRAKAIALARDSRRRSCWVNIAMILQHLAEKDEALSSP